MVYPNLKFQLNKALDKKMAWEFYCQPVFGGVNFWHRGVFALHDALKQMDKVQNKRLFLNKYIDNLYAEHLKEFENRKNEIEQLFIKKEKPFFEAVSKIFKNHPWPTGKYTAYLSIFSFGPRFLNDKTFQLFMYDSNNLILFSICHEMLHFMFYDYAIKNYPKLFGKLDKDKGFFWDLSEVFNAIIQDMPEFIKIHGKIKNQGYPCHKKIITKLNKLWFDKKDIDKWIVKSFEYLKNG